MKVMSTLFRLLPEKKRTYLRWAIATAMEKKLSVNLPKKPTYLAEKHLKNCKLIPTRDVLLKYLPINSVVAEVGVYKGDYSRRIFDVCTPRKLYLIDSWQNEFAPLKQETENNFRDEISNQTVQLIQSDSLLALERFDDNYFDWIYLDSDHSYEVTKRELNVASRKVKKEGLICGHDYTKGNWLAWIRFGVIEAVNEFCMENDFEFVYFTMEPSMYFSYALRKVI